MSKIIANKGQVNEIVFEVVDNKEGSEKQINWANQIKVNKISDMLMILSQPGMSHHKEQILNFCEKMNQIIDAKFWIDNKDVMSKNIAKGIK